MSEVTREAVLRYRMRAQQLDADGPVPPDRSPLLDLGVQDTGPDGGLWALAIRGVQLDDPKQELAMAWTLRGGPHLYRREDLPEVAAAVSPFSEDDAARRVFDAAKPLRAAGRPVLQALGEVAAQLRDVVQEPMDKGAVSASVSARMGEEFLRECRPCQATHLYEMPFRLAALFAGLELELGTSPPVLRRVPGWQRAVGPYDPGTAPARLQLLRGALKLLGPATPKDVAGFLDAPVSEVKRRWPQDAVQVQAAGRTRWLLEEDLAALQAAGNAPAAADRAVRLAGPYDLFLQARDRDLLVPDTGRHKALWPVLGRPGAVLVDGEVAGTWRPQARGRRLTVRLEEWQPITGRARGAVEEQAERLAAHRGVALAGVTSS